MSTEPGPEFDGPGFIDGPSSPVRVESAGECPGGHRLVSINGGPPEHVYSRDEVQAAVGRIRAALGRGQDEHH